MLQNQQVIHEIVNPEKYRGGKFPLLNQHFIVQASLVVSYANLPIACMCHCDDVAAIPSLPGFTSLIKGFRRGEMTVLTGPVSLQFVRLKLLLTLFSHCTDFYIFESHHTPYRLDQEKLHSLDKRAWTSPSRALMYYGVASKLRIQDSCTNCYNSI